MTTLCRKNDFLNSLDFLFQKKLNFFAKQKLDFFAKQKLDFFCTLFFGMNNDLPNYIVNYENEKGKNDNEIHVMHVLRKYAKAGNQAAILFLARRLRAMNCLKTDDRANLNIFKRFSNNGNHVMTRCFAV